MTSVPKNKYDQGGMISGGGSMLGEGGGDLSAMFKVPPEWYHNQQAYPKNNNYAKSYPKNNDYAKSNAGAAGAVVGGAAGFAKGAVAAGMLAKAGILTGGLATVATGGAAPFIGLAAGVMLGGASGSTLGIHGKDVLKASVSAVKGTANAIKYTSKMLSKFNQYSSEKIRSSHDNPEKLKKDLQVNKEAAQKFSKMLAGARDDLKQGKDIKEKLSDLQQYRMPGQNAKKEYSNLLADYHIIKSAKDNNGKVEEKQVKKDYKNFAKENGWSKKRLKSEVSAFNRRIEQHKDDLNMKENNMLDKSLLNQYANSKNKVSQQQNIFNQKSKEKNTGKPIMPANNQKFQKQEQSAQKASRLQHDQGVERGGR